MQTLYVSSLFAWQFNTCVHSLTAYEHTNIRTYLHTLHIRSHNTYFFPCFSFFFCLFTSIRQNTDGAQETDVHFKLNWLWKNVFQQQMITINTLLYSKCLAANGNVRVCKIFIPSNLLGGYNVIQLKVKPEYFIFYSKGSFNVLKFEMTVINCNCFMSVYDLSPNPDSHTHTPILAMTQIGAVTSNAIHRIISLELSIYFDSVHQTNGTTIWNSEKEWRIYWPAGH